MRECVKLTPLTAEERLFSEENYPVLEWCIRVNRLDQDAYDIAYLGYLHAVKKWHAKPELRKWSFKTIVNQTIRCHLSNEQRKEKKRIQTASLDEVIPGTDGMTYMDTITEENVRYLRDMEDYGMEPKIKCNFGVEIPMLARMKNNAHLNPDTKMLLNFLDSAHETMCIEYADPKKAKKSANRFREWKKRHERDDFRVFLFGESIYFEKITKKGEKK